MTDDDRRLGRQKTKRTMMGALLAVLVLLGGAALLATRNTDDTLTPAQTQPTETGLPDLAPASEPIQSPPAIPLPEQPDVTPKAQTP
jgi:cell division protein FtsN